jgi:hypothetical protein
MLATVTCTKETTAGTVGASIFFLAIVGAVVFFVVAYVQSRRKLAVANAELSYLRPENTRLQQWLGGMIGGPGGAQVAPQLEYGGFGPGQPELGAYGQTAIAPQWYADPSGRHELRYWDGSAWTDHVSDHGVTAIDAAH